MSTSHTDGASPCPMCGTPGKKRPRCGKLRFRHKCPHGNWCDQGNPLVGAHSFVPRHSTNCTKCRALPDDAFRTDDLTRLLSGRMTSLGYGFAYAAWIRSSEIKCGWASEGYHYYYAFKTLQRPPEIWEDGTPTSVDYDNDCAP